MQNRQDIDGSQRPKTADAPAIGNPDTGGHLGRGGDPVEGRDPDQAASPSSTEQGVGDHLGPGGDPVEGKTDPSATGGGGANA